MERRMKWRWQLPLDLEQAPEVSVYNRLLTTIEKEKKTLMGLTIHYLLKARGSDARARKLIDALRQAAQDLPFKEVAEIMDLSGEQCDFNKRDQEDPLRWLFIQATKHVDLPVSESEKRQGVSRSKRVRPERLLAFTAWPGEGCEESNVGLCQYPSVVQTETGPIKTGLSDWRWGSFCKTQYASDPACGGVPNFLQCHLSIIALLDKAKELGCLGEVNDEGGFWESRDVQALAHQVGSWNEMLAAFAGKLKDQASRGPVSVESAITRFPNFEELEAAGQHLLPPEFEKLWKLIGRVSRKPLPPPGS